MRKIYEHLAMFDFVPGHRIELAHSLEDVLGDVRLGTRLESALQVMIASVVEHLVLYRIRRNWA